MVLIKSVVKRVESLGESGIWIFIRHPCPLFPSQTLIQSLKESANLVCVAICARQNYGGFAKVQRGTGCRFFFIQFIIFGYIEALCKEVKLEVLVHVETKPHIDEPPGTT